MGDESMINQADYVWLKLQGDQLSFIVATENDNDKSIHGSVTSIRNILEKGRLTGVEIEKAINSTEDLIMPMLRSLPKRNKLMVDGPEFEKVITQRTDDVNVSLEEIESLYRQLADCVEGSPNAWRQAMIPEQVALGLVVVREVMHHGGFRCVSLMPRVN